MPFNKIASLIKSQKLIEMENFTLNVSFYHLLVKKLCSLASLFIIGDISLIGVCTLCDFLFELLPSI
jgi:hypothetical protein